MCFKIGLLGLFAWLVVGIVDVTIRVMCCVNSVVGCVLIVWFRCCIVHILVSVLVLLVVAVLLV